MWSAGEIISTAPDLLTFSRAVGTGGELPGFNTQMFYDTNSDTAVITMTNSDIASGDCPSDVLEDNPIELPCSSPAKRILASVTEALGNPFVRAK